MNTYRVFYVRNEFFASWTGADTKDLPDAFRFNAVCTMEEESLETLFRQMNRVDGTEYVCRLKVRSMSVGDVVLDIAAGKAFRCEMMGWQELPAEVFQSFQRVHPQ